MKEKIIAPPGLPNTWSVIIDIHKEKVGLNAGLAPILGKNKKAAFKI